MKIGQVLNSFKICFSINLFLQNIKLILTVCHIHNLQLSYQIFRSNDFQIDLFNLCIGLTGTIIPGQSELRSNSNEQVPHILPSSPELKPHHQMQFSIIFRTPLLGKSITPQQRIQSVYSKSH